MDESSSESCSVAGYGISNVEFSGSAIKVGWCVCTLVYVNVYNLETKYENLDWLDPEVLSSIWFWVDPIY
jgi:hypothetical protein